MSRLDDEPLSELIEQALRDLQDFAQAEIALARDEISSLSTSLLVALPLIMAALVLGSLGISVVLASFALSPSSISPPLRW